MTAERAEELLEKKQKGQPIAAAKKSPPSNVYNLMDALRASIKGDQRNQRKNRQTKKARSAKPAVEILAGPIRVRTSRDPEPGTASCLMMRIRSVM